MHFAIQFLDRNNIDNDKWNRCIGAAGNGLVYAYTNYLDGMCTHWSALILNDYEAVMPLPWRKKWGIHYLYQPAFIAQLGVFGNYISQPLFNAFLQAIPKKFRFLDFMLNHKNVYPSTLFPQYQRSNYVLDLSPPYLSIWEQYRESTQRNIKKANAQKSVVKRGIAIEEVIHLAKQQTVQAGITEDDFLRFEKVYNQMHSQNKGITYGVYTANGQLLASCAFIFSHERAYYILVGNHPNGRTLGASHKLIDAFIKDHAEKPLLLDFEGSDVRNVAFFYSSFGAVEEKYAAIKWNRLPWYAKWLKR